MLDTPLSIGGAVAPSRLVFGPHVTNLGRGRAISDRHVAYYERRARGGCGVVVIETASVHPSDWPYERAPLAEACAPGWRDVAAAVHDHGALAFASIGHCGLQGSTAYSQGVLWAPSAMAHVSTHEVALALGPVEIAALRRGAAHAAELAVESGLDGVELNVGQLSIFRQFLSGLTNHRDDEWSAGTALVAATLADLRGAVGGAVLGLRLSADELAPWAGITPESARALAAELAPLVDYVVLERGSIYSEAATRPDMQVTPGFNVSLLDTLGPVVAPTPLIAQGSIVEVAMAESLLASGRCAAVEMTRALIADPDLGAKAAGRRPDAVRPCVLCNQGCQVRDVRNPIVSCAVNPTAGHELSEYRLDDDGPTGELAGRTVAVCGAGPAGLEAARRAALAGARVVVRERTERVGGALNDAARLPGRSRWGALVAWYEGELSRLGVEVITGSTVGDDERADVVAIGRTPGRLECRDGDDGSVPVIPPAAALTLAGGFSHALVVDPVGGPIGVGLAERLAPLGRVSLLTPDLVAGSQLSLTGDLVGANARLAALGVELITHSALVGLTDRRAVIEDRYTGAVSEVEVDLVVDAGFDRPAETGPEGPRVGDALAPRGCYQAVLEARRAVASLVGR